MMLTPMTWLAGYHASLTTIQFAPYGESIMKNKIMGSRFLKTVLLLFGVSLVDMYLIMGILAKYWMFNFNDFGGACLYACPIGLLSSVPLLFTFKHNLIVALTLSIVLTSLIFIPLAIGASC